MMADVPEISLSVTRNPGMRGDRAWSIESKVEYPGFPNPSLTYRGASSLGAALYEGLDMAAARGWKVDKLVVDGKNLSKSDALDLIEGSRRAVAYRLPQYEKLLEGKLRTKKPAASKSMRRSPMRGRKL